ncbi:thiol reductase thioredoxin [candidate division KSB1 bacterium]|nr:thiol reductase thioredoxin [candidate division KSB1 bacterium]NIR71209.1 thiol reductase thioredoxin [candidate division KSB1 bacterium]NIS23313.1 thiol reductase thioredoxin [candidate division KSB1 bacterium]NIT70192.1 thiol reductase thioredoxin [candidate division KSB1 bacterium]NIU23844.1 thiol reductase thioredoxin [candidate division KSB1 bacterium]
MLTQQKTSDRQELFTVLTDDNFRKEVIESRGSVLVEVGADWCGTCHIIAPVLEKLAITYKGQIKFAKVDIEATEHVAREYGVTELPVLLFFKRGQIVDHLIGAAPKKIIVQKLNALLKE